MRYSHEKRLKILTVGFGSACSNGFVRLQCGPFNRATGFGATASLPEPCPTISAANGGSTSAGLGGDDDAADPAEAVSVFSGLTGVVVGGSPLLARHSKRRACRSSNSPLAERNVAVGS